MVGAWSDFVSPITKDEKEVFDAVMKSWIGVSYMPIAAATQTVSGKNYSYICLAKAVAPETKVTVAKIIIYKPLKGDPHITSIEHIAP